MRCAESRFPGQKRTDFESGFAPLLSRGGRRRAWIAVNAGGAITGPFESRAPPGAAAAHRALLGMGVHRALSPTRTWLEPGA